MKKKKRKKKKELYSLIFNLKNIYNSLLPDIVNLPHPCPNGTNFMWMTL